MKAIIIDIGKKDSYYEDREVLIGKKGKFLNAGKLQEDDEWSYGEFIFDKKTLGEKEISFFQVKVEPLKRRKTWFS